MEKVNILFDDDIYLKYKREARIFAESYYSWDAVAQEYLGFVK
jgi:glycosyltransferase involved in cell wall biosynthesis